MPKVIIEFTEKQWADLKEIQRKDESDNIHDTIERAISLYHACLDNQNKEMYFQKNKDGTWALTIPRTDIDIPQEERDKWTKKN